MNSIELSGDYTNVYSNIYLKEFIIKNNVPISSYLMYNLKKGFSVNIFLNYTLNYLNDYHTITQINSEITDFKKEELWHILNRLIDDTIDKGNVFDAHFFYDYIVINNIKYEFINSNIELMLKEDIFYNNLDIKLYPKIEHKDLSVKVLRYYRCNEFDRKDNFEKILINSI